MYGVFSAFLRPHRWRMAGTLACNIIAAVLDVFTLDAADPVPEPLFNQPHISPVVGVPASDCSGDMFGSCSIRDRWARSNVICS